MSPIDLPTFLCQRRNELVQEAADWKMPLPEEDKDLVDDIDQLHKHYETAQGTLARVPTGYAQGVLEGLRQALVIIAQRWADHADYDPHWVTPHIHTPMPEATHDH